MKRLLACLLSLVLFLPYLAFAEDDAIPASFKFGADVSTVLSEENSGVVYRNRDGEPTDLFVLLKEAGWDTVRVRVWNDPFDEDGRGYGGGNCGVANAVEIARRCKEAGLSLIVDFHYSDFWADPAKQMSPKAWVTMDLTQKCSALYAFTTDALTQIAATGVDIWMVQVGNEINGGMAGEWSTNGRNQLMNAGSAAVRATLPDALVAVHFTNVSQSDAKKYIREVCEGDTPVDFDVMAYSYYSYWHGSLENLSELMADVRENFGKDVFIAETAYPFTTNNLDTHPNSVPNEWCDMKQDISRDGQAADFRETVETAVQAASATGNRRGFRCREIAGKNRVSCGNSSVRAGRAAMPVGMTRRTRAHGSVDAHGRIRRSLRWMGHRHGRFRFRIFFVVNKRATRGRSMITKSTQLRERVKGQCPLQG